MAEPKAKKFMDVAKKPEEATADIGTKPMIVGHKAETDPMVRDAESPAPESVATEVKLVPPSQKLKTLAPLPKATDPTETAESKEVTEEKVAEKSVTTDELSKEPAKIEKPEEKPEIDPVAAEMEKDEELRKLIASKKYFVSVKQARTSNPFVIVVMLILVVLLGLGTLFYLVDTEKLDLGFKLPFSLFNKKEAQSSNEAPVVSNPEQASPIVAEVTRDTSAYTNTAYGVGFDYPKSWGDVKVEQINGFEDQKYEKEAPYYLNVTFSAQKEVELRIINGRAFEGGKDYLSPLGVVDAFVDFYQNKAFSYKKLTNGDYQLIRVSNENTEKNLSSDALKAAVFTLTEDSDTLIIQPKWTLENLDLLPWKPGEDETMTQKEAEALLATNNKQVLFVRNYSTETIQGINASYTWASAEKDTVVETALLELIKTVK